MAAGSVCIQLTSTSVCFSEDTDFQMRYIIAEMILYILEFPIVVDCIPLSSNVNAASAMIPTSRSADDHSSYLLLSRSSIVVLHSMVRLSSLWCWGMLWSG